MKLLWKFAEYLVLSRLVLQDIEAYPAIKANQEDYDITAVISANKVVRIQIKATELENKSTNNSIRNINKKYDFLVIVIKSTSDCRIFVLSKNEVSQLIGTKNFLSVSRLKQGVSHIRDEFFGYEEKWEKITNA